jgi:hypothetical protein
MRKMLSFRKNVLIIICTVCSFWALQSVSAANDPDNVKYAKRFLDLYTKIKAPVNGYFSPQGIPYHSVETLICEAPDYGHETTSEAVSYWLWLEGMFGFMTNQWDDVKTVWNKAEQYIIPSQLDQPTGSFYKPGSPATYVPEEDDPSQYPAPVDASVTAGSDPIANELQSTYGTSNVYGMHWLLDVDNWYGFGLRGDKTSKPAYINTFQRGTQESVWETVPQPCWDDFSSGGPNGFLDLFVNDPSGYSKQWKYTDAPDADARMIQAMYWCYAWAKEKGQDPASVLPLDKAAKMGDYLRYALFDKYFRNVNCTTSPCNDGAYNNAHYLLSWYYAWGGAIDPAKGWAWRIGCSHNHFGYQNPVAAYVLGNIAEFKPKSPNAARDWNVSFNRQFEFYQWLQSAEGAIGGGATNSWKGRYLTPPANTSTFYGLSYVEAPVYSDPPSNSWFGWQAWSMQRMGEIFYITGDPRVEKVMDRWFSWVKQNVKLNADGSFAIPSEIGWSGQPDNWTGAATFTGNPNYHVSVVSYSEDLGVAASLARSLIHYNFAKKKVGKPLDSTALYLAKQIIDRIYNTCSDQLGYSAVETRSDYSRFLNQTVFIPTSFSGKMPNGDLIKPGIKFLSIRSKYVKDPAFADMQTAVTANQAPAFRYHRFWAQCEIALAFAEYARFSQPDPNTAPITVSKDSINGVIQSIAVRKPAALKPLVQEGLSIIKTGSSLALSSSIGRAVTIRIVNMAGREVCSRQIPAFGTVSLGVNAFKSGYYLLQMTNEKSQQVVQPLMMMN